MTKNCYQPELCIKTNNSGYFLILIFVKQAFVFYNTKNLFKNLVCYCCNRWFFVFPFTTSRSNNSLQSPFVFLHLVRTCIRYAAGANLPLVSCRCSNNYEAIAAAGKRQCPASFRDFYLQHQKSRLTINLSWPGARNIGTHL